jgi:hypothetical protein
MVIKSQTGISYASIHCWGQAGHISQLIAFKLLAKDIILQSRCPIEKALHLGGELPVHRVVATVNFSHSVLPRLQVHAGKRGLGKPFKEFSWWDQQSSVSGNM